MKIKKKNLKMRYICPIRISKLYHCTKLYCMFQADTTTSTYTVTTTEDITADPRGIPGWDKVGQLAEELVGLTGIAVSTAQAERIKALCNALDDYDKRAIEVHLRSQQPSLRGHFCSRKEQGIQP